MSGRYSLYLLYWYKSTNTDVPDDERAGFLCARAADDAHAAGTPFTCFAGTKVQILTQVLQESSLLRSTLMVAQQNVRCSLAGMY